MKWQQVTPPSISTWSKYSSLSDYSDQGAGTLTMAPRQWVANLAIYIPFWLPFHYPVKRVWWQNGSNTGGTSDAGVYTWEGKRIYSTGPTTNVTNSVPQYISCDFLLSPGWYYHAFMHTTSTVNQCYGNNGPTLLRARELGWRQEATAGVLPVTATFAAYATQLVEHHGITRIASGF